jgi:hypothetical protein
VLFARAADLVRQLLEARDARELGRLQRRLLTQDVLTVDLLGFVPFDRVGGELLFNLLAARKPSGPPTRRGLGSGPTGSLRVRSRPRRWITFRATDWSTF